jgi:methyltransferase (TIGR00027 family)
MSEAARQNLTDVSETLLFPLYVRAIETQRPDAILKDDKALALVQQESFNFSRIQHAPHDEETMLAVLLRNREFDRCTRDYLSHFPDAVVVHIGCGLDARFERVDNGKVEWYDLDLPEVIALRRKFIGGEGKRYHLLAHSMFDSAWLNEVSFYPQRPFLFLAEGVLMYFEESQVRSFVLMLRDHFPGAELVFDAFSPFFVWANNRRVARTGFGARCHWNLKHGKDLETWGADIQLLDEWFPFQCPEPRLAHMRWARSIPLLAKTMGVFHYRLTRTPPPSHS